MCTPLIPALQRRRLVDLRSVLIQGCSTVHSEFQAIQDYRGRPCLKKAKRTNWIPYVVIFTASRSLGPPGRRPAIVYPQFPTDPCPTYTDEHSAPEAPKGSSYHHINLKSRILLFRISLGSVDSWLVPYGQLVSYQLWWAEDPWTQQNPWAPCSYPLPTPSGRMGNQAQENFHGYSHSLVQRHSKSRKEQLGCWY